MATKDDVRRIASHLPGAIEGEGRFGFSVIVKGKHKGFCWEWAERVTPKKPRVLNPEVLAISVRNVEMKAILEGQPLAKSFVQDPHYDGFPAVLVRLSVIEAGDLEDLLIEAWRTKAPKVLQQEFDSAP